MTSMRSPYRILFFLSLLFATVFTCQAQTDVLTWHNDNARTGQNLSESILTPALVNWKNFGLLANVKVDGKVDAQPLYVTALTFPTIGTHNVLYIATEHDTVYAVEADSGKILWQRSMLGSGETPSDDFNCSQVVPEIGITSTPVIDRLAGPHGTIFLVAMSKNASGSYFHRIHALDLMTGVEQPNSPVVVKATYPGTGDGSANGLITFDPKQYKERPGLLLLNGTIFTSWGSHCDHRPYGGWIMAYAEKALTQASVLEFVPNGGYGAPWNAGAGPAADSAGNIYISLGNGTFDTTLTPQGFPIHGDYGNALVKLSFVNNKLSVVDYWTMYNSTTESGGDRDLGSGGFMLLPDLLDSKRQTRHLAVAAGKDGNLYVADRDNMGHYDEASDATIYQQLTGALPGGVWSSPAYFNGHVYYGSVGSDMRSFEIASAKLNSSPQTTATAYGYPGTTPSVSAYKTTNAIVWASESRTPEVLHAYDANNLNVEFYNSDQASSRDYPGVGNKFMVPTIANGKVYLGTQDSVAIFGLLRQTPPIVPDGDYVLVNQNSKLVMDDPRATPLPGQVMWQYPSDGQTEQKWFFSFNGHGFYTIQNVASKLFLTDPNTTPTPGASLVQDPPNYEDSQLWSLAKSGSGYVITNKLTKLAIDDLGKQTANGPYVGLMTLNYSADEIWTLQ